MEAPYSTDTRLRGWLNGEIRLAQCKNPDRQDGPTESESAFQKVLNHLDKSGDWGGYNGGTISYKGQSCIIAIYKDEEPELIWHDRGPLSHELDHESVDTVFYDGLPTEPGLYLWNGTVSFSQNWTDCGWEYDMSTEGKFRCLATPDWAKPYDEPISAVP